MSGLSLVDMYGGSNSSVTTPPPNIAQVPNPATKHDAPIGEKSTTAAWVAAVLVLVAIRVLWELAEEV